MFPGAALPVNLALNGWLTMRDVLKRAGWWLAPARCVLCGSPAPRARLDLCPHCRRLLPWQQRHWQPAWPGAAARLNPWRYAYPVDAMLKALKFRGERCHARVLGTLLAEARRAVPVPLPQLVVPIPLHPARWRERGYNQAQELARYTAGNLGLPLRPDLLVRQRNTRPQTDLDNAQRRDNMHNAFRCPRALPSLDLALVDDVMTTGSTARAAAAALCAAGARRVELWVAARAQRDSGEVVVADQAGQYHQPEIVVLVEGTKAPGAVAMPRSPQLPGEHRGADGQGQPEALAASQRSADQP